MSHEWGGRKEKKRRCVWERVSDKVWTKIKRKEYEGEPKKEWVMSYERKEKERKKLMSKKAWFVCHEREKNKINKI